MPSSDGKGLRLYIVKKEIGKLIKLIAAIVIKTIN